MLEERSRSSRGDFPEDRSATVTISWAISAVASQYVDLPGIRSHLHSLRFCTLGGNGDSGESNTAGGDDGSCPR